MKDPRKKIPVPDVPDQDYEALKELARRDRRSLGQFTAALLTERLAEAREAGLVPATKTHAAA